MSPSVKTALISVCVGLIVLGVWRLSTHHSTSRDQSVAGSERESPPPSASQPLPDPRRPELTVVEVFRWGYAQQRPRLYGVYGRPMTPMSELKSEQTRALLASHLPSHLMYRGQMESKVFWLSDHWLKSPQQPSEVPEELMRTPTQITDLNTLLIAVERRLQVTPDPLLREGGERLIERRVYRSVPPYHLVAMSTHRETKRGEERGEERESYWRGRWSYQASPELEPIIQDLPTPAETLLSERRLSAGAYQVYRLERGRVRAYELSLTERRREYLNGAWVELDERSLYEIGNENESEPKSETDHKDQAHRPHHSSRQGLVTSNDGEVFAWRISPSLRLVSRKPKELSRRAPLPLSQSPLELELLPKPQGHLSSDLMRRAIGSHHDKLKRCERWGQGPSTFGVRLVQSARGRVQSVSITTPAPLKLALCVTRELSNLTLPLPRKPANSAQSVNSGDRALPFVDRLVSTYQLTLPITAPTPP